LEMAIACGADAVYLGLPDFNARKKAENFDIAGLRDHIKRAHFFGVKVYVTVNTLVKDEELPSVLDAVRAAVEAKADAFIVQDLGVAKCMKNSFPNIVLHASTQLGVHNLYGARQAERLGFKRVVLARETKLDDIHAIRDGTSLEIEFFVQGALCVAFSGNCYLSAVEQGASGNRGLCKQLCRLPYEAEIAGEKHNGFLLSARDLCLANSLADLIDAGVTSFKIEGRMRREGYVGAAVSVYRRLLDDISKGIRATLTQNELESLRLAYSRGESYLDRAYLDDGTPDVIEKAYNNHTGVLAGEVREVKPFKTGLYKVVVYSRYSLRDGDGLKFFKKKHDGYGWEEAASAGVGGVSSCGEGMYSFATKAAVKVGWRVNLIFSCAAEERLRATRRFVQISLSVTALAGKPLSLEARCLDGRASVCLQGEICQRAVNASVSEADLAAQASKTADSGFYVSSCDVKTDGVFVAKSVLNALRRETLAALGEKIFEAAEENHAAVGHVDIKLPMRRKYPDIVFAREADPDALKARERETVVVCPSRYDAEYLRKIINRLPSDIKDIALQLPVIANGADLKSIEKALASAAEIKTLVIENIYGFEFASRGYKIIAGAGLNALNAVSAQVCADLGAEAVLPSVESGKREGIRGAELPLMTFAHCPYKTARGNDCAHCSFKEGMTLSRGGRKYEIRRVKAHGCYFGLFEKA